jgi:hypothetical protein
MLTIKGNSPDEYVVTNFGRSLEFSSGLFTNLNIETQRKEVAATQIADNSGAPAPDNKPETINFTIRCAYTPSKAAKPSDLPNGGTPQTASSNAAPANPPQTAKN